MIHQYNLLGLNIVMDVYSGAVHIADDVMYEMLFYLKEPFVPEDKCPKHIIEMIGDKYSSEELEEAYADIVELYNKGQLFTEDSYAEIAKKWKKQSVVKALCLHVAHDCNLRCKYCFGDTGEFNGPRGLMSAEVGKKAIDFVIENHSMRVETGILNEIMAEAVAMQQPPSDKGKRLKLFYITQVAVKPPTFVIFVNDKELMHFSYTRYIENKIREAFGFKGTPLRFIIRERKEK